MTDPAAGLPGFRERWPWRGGDLQTVRNILTPPRVRLDDVATRTLTFPMDDGTGDILNGELHEPEETGRPLVVLIHGLTGCFDSEYIRVSARFWLGRGHPVLRVNLRAAGTDQCALPGAVLRRSDAGSGGAVRGVAGGDAGPRDSHYRLFARR